MKAYLLLPRLDGRDAMANDAMAMQERLQALGWDATILCAGGALRSRFRKLSRDWLSKADPGDLIIYHYGIAWEAGDDFFQAFPGKRVLRYHNVTPPKFYEPYHSGIARACEEGLRRVALLKADVAWCVSEYNVRSLRATGWKGNAVVLPPFHRIEEILARPLNLRKLRRQLEDRNSAKRNGQLDLIFLGRQVPNKAIPETISMLDRALQKAGRLATLRLVGSRDPALKEYSSQIDRAARGARNLSVSRAGSLDEQSLKSELLMADALVHFSLHEGFCIPVLEAMALGVPVIAARAEAMKDTLNSHAFLEFEEEAIAGRLRDLCEDSVAVQDLVRKGLCRYAQHFHPAVIASRMNQLLDHLYEDRAPANGTIEKGWEELRNEQAQNNASVPEGAASGSAAVDSFSSEARGSGGSSGPSEDSGIGIVVVRFGKEFAGGSEREALEYAHLLKEAGHRITVLTSCARNAGSWANEYPEGESTEDGIRILRFPSVRERNPYWSKLDRILRKGARCLDWGSRPALSLEWIRGQGPFLPGLQAYLATNGFHRLLFMTYLYYPSVCGAAAHDRRRNFLVPTLHDELPARFGAVRLASGMHQNMVWNTAEEGKLGATLWHVRGGSIVGAPVLPPEGLQTDIGAGSEPATRGKNKTQSPRLQEPTFLYIGRWDAGKGTKTMMSLLAEYSRIRSFRLHILGSGNGAGLPRFAHHLGFVPEAEKQRQLRSCTALIVPSEMESFSIVTLEAMAAGTPVIVNGRNEVLEGHCERAGCGIVYHTAAEFLEGLERAVQGLPETELNKGRAYVTDQYSRAVVRNRLLEALDLLS